MVPDEKMSDAVMEKDICGFVLSVDARVDQTLFKERGAEQVFLAEEQHLPGSRRVASTPLYSSTGAREIDGDVEGGGGGVVLAPLAATEELDHAPVGGAVGVVSIGVYKHAMPEMLRLGEYFRR